MPFFEITQAKNEHLKRFDQTVGEVFQKEGRDALWRCESAFRELIDSEFLREHIHAAIDGMLSEPFNTAHYGHKEHQIILQKADYAVELQWGSSARLDRAQSLATQSCDAMIAVANDYEVPIDFYNLDGVDQEVFNPQYKLTRGKRVVAKPREILHIHGADELIDPTFVPGACVIMFVTPPRFTQILSFDRDTLTAWGTSAAQQEITQIKVALQMFRMFNSEDAIPTAVRLFDHPAHDIRWEVVKTVMHLSKEEGIKLLRRAVTDRHPHVKNAASKTLQSLSI